MPNPQDNPPTSILADNYAMTQAHGGTPESRERVGMDNERKTLPYSMAIKGLQDKLSTIDQTKDPAAYQATVDDIQKNIHAMREIFHPDAKLGVGDWLKQHTTDRLHITNHAAREADLKKRQDAAGNADKAQAVAYAQATPADAIGQYQTDFRRITGRDMTPEENTAFAEKRGGYTSAPKDTTETERFVTNYKAQHPGATDEQALRAYTDAITKAPNNKPVRGALVKTLQSPTGWATTFINPQTGKVAFWTPTTPSRYYEGTTSSSTTTDPFGVTTQTSRATMPVGQTPVDINDLMEIPDPDHHETAPADTPHGDALPSAPTAAAAAAKPEPSTPRAATPLPPHARTPYNAPQHAHSGAAPKPSGHPVSLDSSGHIPESAANAGLVSAANMLLNGMDVDKLPLPQRDRQAAATLAARYGWGQGTFTPKELIPIKEAQAFIGEAARNPSLSVLDDPGSRARLGLLIGDQQKNGIFGKLTSVAASQGMNEQEQEFLRMYNQLIGTIGGLSAVTRNGKSSEALVNRLMQEVPNPLTTVSGADARERLARILQEINVAFPGGIPGANTHVPVGPRTQSLNSHRATSKKLTVEDLERAIHQ